MTNKPFLEMDELELRRTFDEMGADNNAGMLDEARSSVEESRVFTLSIVMLRTLPVVPKGSLFEGMRILHWNPEYGDDEARISMGEFVSELRCSKLLHEGESVERYLGELSLDDSRNFSFSVDEVKQQFNEEMICSPGRVCMLEEARSDVEESRAFTLSIAMLRTLPESDGSPFEGLRILHWNPEYGDDDARISMGEFVRELRRSKLLREGESVERYFGKLSLDDSRNFSLSIDEVKMNQTRRKRVGR